MNDAQLIEQRDTVWHGKYGRAVVIYTKPTYATICYGPNYEVGDSVLARWATVPLSELTVVKKARQ